MSAADALPLDVLPLILEHLHDRRDLCTCAQLSRAFHHAATPLLYRTLDVRVVSRDRRKLQVRSRPIAAGGCLRSQVPADRVVQGRT